MADIFISYSKKERNLTEGLAKDLEAAGYSVWWDTNLITGDSYQNVIVKELKECRAAIVIWTPSSTQSEWVYSEANRANRDKKLIPVRVQEVDLYDIPPPFDVRQTELVSNRRAIFMGLQRIGVLPASLGSAQEQVAPAHPARPEPPAYRTEAPVAAPPPSPEIAPHFEFPSPPPQAQRSDQIQRFATHWRRTRRLAVSVLAVWAVVALGIHLGAVSLNQLRFLGFPFGFYMAAQGSLIAFVAMLYWFTKRQDQIDREAVIA